MPSIVFDMLDTLLDESGIYKKFYSVISKKYSLDFEPQDFVKRFFVCEHKWMAPNFKKQFKEVIKEAYLEMVKGAGAKDLNLLFDLHKEMVFLPDIKEMLLRLNNKYKFFILTNCSNDLVKNIDIASKSPVKFQKIFTSEDNGVYKPNPPSYQIVIDYIKEPVNNIIYCSSNKWDLIASKKFGFDSKSVEELKEASADILLKV